MARRPSIVRAHTSAFVKSIGRLKATHPPTRCAGAGPESTQGSLSIRPGSPQENGRHDRMHRTLKAPTSKPPTSDAYEQPARAQGQRRRRRDRSGRRRAAIPAAVFAGFQSDRECLLKAKGILSRPSRPSTHDGDPGDRDKITAQNIARIVHAKIDAGPPNRQHKQNRRHPDSCFQRS